MGRYNALEAASVYGMGPNSIIAKPEGKGSGTGSSNGSANQEEERGGRESSRHRNRSQSRRSRLSRKQRRGRSEIQRGQGGEGGVASFAPSDEVRSTTKLASRARSWSNSRERSSRPPANEPTIQTQIKWRRAESPRRRIRSARSVGGRSARQQKRQSRRSRSAARRRRGDESDCERRVLHEKDIPRSGEGDVSGSRDGGSHDGRSSDNGGRSHDRSSFGRSEFIGRDITIQPLPPPEALGAMTPRRSLLADFKGMPLWNMSFTAAQLLSGMSVALAQVPECVSYACIAGIDPFHALQAAWLANVLTPIVGGRPGLLCGPSGLGAIALRHVVANYGQEYVFYAVMLSGLCQVLFGGLRIGKYLRLLPTGITIGMVNALCVLLFLLQLRYFKVVHVHDLDDAVVPESNLEASTDTYSSSTAEEPKRRLESAPGDAISEESLGQPWAYFLGYDLPWAGSSSRILVVVLEAVAALATCSLLPRCISVVPSSLVAMLLVTAVNVRIRVGTDWDAPTVGDYFAPETNQLPASTLWKGIFNSAYDLPNLFEWNTVRAVCPAGLSLFCINLLETMVAINVVDRYTGGDSEQDRVFYGQGVANLAGGLMGGIAGSGSVHTSLHGLRMGGVTSLSSFFAGVYMLMVVSFAYPAVAVIPLGATMGVTLHLICHMMQRTPIMASALKFVPGCCLRGRPVPPSWRLATPDLLSAWATSIFALCAGSWALAGYLVGALCYACDPIGHSIISGSNPNGYSFMELGLSQPPAAKPCKIAFEKRSKKEIQSKDFFSNLAYDEEMGSLGDKIHDSWSHIP